MISDPTFYAVAALAVVIWDISKARFGGGLVLISVPMLTLVIPPLEAAAIMLPILCVMDLFGIWEYRRTWRRETMSVLFAGVALGTIAGAITLGSVNEAVLRPVIGVMAIGFSIHYFVARDNYSKGRRPGPGVGFTVATAAGVASFIMHAGHHLSAAAAARQDVLCRYRDGFRRHCQLRQDPALRHARPVHPRGATDRTRLIAVRAARHLVRHVVAQAHPQSTFYAVGQRHRRDDRYQVDP